MRCRWIRLSLLFILPICLVSSSVFAKETIKLFIVYSRDPSALRGQDLQSGIVKAISKHGYEVSVRSDSIHYRLDEIVKQEGVVESILINQIKEWEPDYVVVHSTRAAEKFSGFNAELFAQWPIVFSGIPQVPEGLDDKYPQATFVIDEFPLRSTIDLILELDPELDRIVFIGTSSKLQNKYRFQEVNDLEVNYRNRIAFKKYFDVPVNVIHDELTQSSTKDAIVELEDLVDDAGNIVRPNIFYPSLHAKKKIPVYTFWYPTRNYEVVGGDFFIEKAKGRRAGEVIVKGYEKRRTPRYIEVDTSKTYLFWDQLKYYDINPDNLPKGVVLVNQPQFLTKQQRAMALYVGCFIVGLWGIIFVLVRAIRKCVRAETELANINIDLKRKNDQLMLLSVQRSEYLSIVTHDLKNPIAAIVSMCSYIYDFGNSLSQPKKSELDASVDFINKASKEMLSRIDSILHEEELASAINGLKVERVNISEIARKVLAVNSVNALAKQVRIDQTGPENDLPAYADASKVEEIFDNLISNAIKYSPREGVVRVRWGLNSDQANWVFEVEDQGNGFTEDDQGLLFQRFQKLSAKPTGNEGSSGFGLYITKRNVDLHDGKITLKSGVKGGAIFTVTIPVNTAADSG